MRNRAGESWREKMRKEKGVGEVSEEVKSGEVSEKRWERREGRWR